MHNLESLTLAQEGIRILGTYFLTTHPLLLIDLVRVMNTGGAQTLEACGQALVSATHLGPLHLIPSGTFVEIPIECGGNPYWELQLTILVGLGFFASLGLAARMFINAVLDIQPIDPPATPYSTRPVSEASRLFGRVVPESARDMESPDYQNFLEIVGRAQEDFHNRRAKILTSRKVEDTRNTVEMVFAAFRMPVRFMYASVNTTVYLLALSKAIMTGAMREIICQLTGASSVEVVESHDPNLIEAYGVEVQFDE